MTKTKSDYVYAEVKELLRLAWQDDDIMEQETLYELQERLTRFALHLAVDAHKETDLVASFPYLYSTK